MAHEGMFVWYDLMTTDLDASLAFYRSVLGWETEDSGMPGPGPYMMLKASGQAIGGGMQLTPEMTASGARTGWMGHIHTADVDAMAKTFTDAGGAIHTGPGDIPAVGRFAIVSDPYGAVVSLFSPAAQYTGSPPLPPGTAGDCGWRELHSLDGEAAGKFYAGQFGWTQDMAVDMGPMGAYLTFKGAGAEAPMVGIMTKTDQMPAPMWVYYFNVDSVEAAVERAKAAGGTLLMGPHKVPSDQWIAMFLDPQGGMFAVLSPNA